MKRTSLLENSKPSTFYENIRMLIPLGYASLAPFGSTVSKDRILICRLPSRYLAQLRRERTLQCQHFYGLYDQEKYRTYAIFDMGNMKFLCEAACLPADSTIICPEQCYSGISSIKVDLQHSKDEQICSGGKFCNAKARGESSGILDGLKI